MAAKTTRRRSTGKKTGKTTSKRAATTVKRNNNKNQTEPNPVTIEIALCLVLAVSILMILGNFSLAGRIGNGFSDLLFGLFGLMEHLFPILLFFGIAFYAANRENRLIVRKMTGLCFLFVFFSALLELLENGFVKGRPLTDYFEASALDHTGGGILGGFLVFLFHTAFGLVGAYTLIVAGLIISTVMLTQKPLLTSLGKKSKDAARAAGRQHRANLEERRLEREERRQLARPTYDGLPVDLPKKKVEPKTAKAKKATRATQAITEPEFDRRKEAEEPGSLSGEPFATLDLSEIHINGSALTDEEIESARTSHLDDANPQKTRVKRRTKSQEGIFQMPAFLRADKVGEDPFARAQVSEPIPASAGAKELMAQQAGEEEVNPSKRSRADKLPKSSPKEKEQDIMNIQLEIHDKEGEDKAPVYQFPPTSLLTGGKAEKKDSKQYLMDTAAKLQSTLQNFGVNVHVINVSRGPTVTRFELQPEQGVKVSRIVNLQDDIKLNLAASEIRIEAPIPGKAAVGIEVPNKESSPVMMKDLLETEEFRNSKAKLAFAVGKDIAGRPVISDIEKMPHLLIAGATGSGKSVCINTLIISILYKYRPDEVKLLMIDPKVVELKIYDGIPHLLIPVVTDAKKAAGALNWAVSEMTDRYNKFASHPGIRDIKGYNKFVEDHNKHLADDDKPLAKMPRIIVIVDELADLMMVASGEVEDAICRLAQLARAAGIHLIIATQRPSVNVVTGLIKANMPSRIALAVTSGIDSRTILDMNGAEKLLGKGDMLFDPQGYPKPARVQGAFVTDDDITRVVDFLTSQGTQVEYNKDIEQNIENQAAAASSPTASADEKDEYFADAGRLIIEKDKASIGMLQRAFKIGFNRAARIMDQLCDAGIVGEEEGTKPRKILVSMEEYEAILAGLNS